MSSSGAAAGEREPRGGRHVMDELRHAPALVDVGRRPSESTCTFEVYPHGFFLPGRSPDLMSCLALVIELWPVSKESEMIPIFWP